MKKYDLKTIKEILDVITPENIEVFKKDFCAFLDYDCEIKKATKEMPNIEIMPADTFKWIDDGKNDVYMNIKIETKI